ncbi:MAG: hypothetical protein H0X37_25645 [Herpetosiphonaceae bacterium]|nr:hypothetical protein [Herpetosiphonaceae bacterium]
MGGLYNIIKAVHNAVGGLTLLLTIAATVLLLTTRRTSSGSSAIILRADLISGSLQFVLGLLLVVISFITGIGYGAQLWVHYLLGIASVGLISVLVARARRAPDSEARRYGLLLLAVAVLVLITFTVGQRKLFAT